MLYEYGFFNFLHFISRLTNIIVFLLNTTLFITAPGSSLPLHCLPPSLPYSPATFPSPPPPPLPFHLPQPSQHYLPPCPALDVSLVLKDRNVPEAPSCSAPRVLTWPAPDESTCIETYLTYALYIDT